MNDDRTPDYGYGRWALIAAGALLLAIIMWSIRGILLLGLAAVILVIWIDIPITRLMKVGLGRRQSILITIIGAILLAYILTLIVLPILLGQFTILVTEIIPRGVEEAVNFWNTGQLQEHLGFLYDLEILSAEPESRIDLETVRSIGEQVVRTLGQLGTSLVPFLGGLANTGLSLLIVLFMTAFFLADPERYREGAIQLFPLWYRERIRFILNRLQYLLRRWIYGQMIGMTITGVGTYIGLSLIGIDQAAALGVATAIFSFVPNFGELLSVLLALSVGVVQAPDRLLWIVVVIYGVSFIQGQIIGPLIASESVDIPPALILLGQITVATFFGVIGIVLAVPIMVILMVIVQEVYISDILGDRDASAMREANRTRKVDARKEKGWLGRLNRAVPRKISRTDQDNALADHV